MSSSIVVQPSVYTADTYGNSFFFKSPTDVKYLSSRYHAFSPISSMKNTKKITFSLPSFSNPTLWDLGNSYLEMSLKIVDEDGKIPDAETYVVGFVNNALHSLFSDAKLIINGKAY